MNCKQVYKILYASLEGKLDGYQQKLLEQHLQECNTCNQAYTRLSQTEHLFNKTKIHEKSPFFTQRVMDKLPGSNTIVQSKKSQVITFSVKAASVAAAVFLGVMLAGNINHSSEKSYSRSDYLQALGESHYLLDTEYTLEDMFLFTNGEEEQ